MLKKGQFVVLGHLFLIKNRLPHFSIAQSLIIEVSFQGEQMKWDVGSYFMLFL